VTMLSVRPQLSHGCQLCDSFSSRFLKKMAASNNTIQDSRKIILQMLNTVGNNIVLYSLKTVHEIIFLKEKSVFNSTLIRF
jgi:hypothetical protein